MPVYARRRSIRLFFRLKQVKLFIYQKGSRVCDAEDIDKTSHFFEAGKSKLVLYGDFIPPPNILTAH